MLSLLFIGLFRLIIFVGIKTPFYILKGFFYLLIGFFKILFGKKETKPTLK